MSTKGSPETERQSQNRQDTRFPCLARVGDPESQTFCRLPPKAHCRIVAGRVWELGGQLECCIAVSSKIETFHFRGKLVEIEDINREMKHSIMQRNSLNSGSKQLKGCRKPLKPIRFTRLFLVQAYISCKGYLETVGVKLSHREEAEFSREEA